MGAIVYDPMTGKFVSAQEAIADAAASGVATLTAGATTGGDTLKELEDRIAALEDAPESGTSVAIPISTTEGDWVNTDGAWVFNGDGTVTSTGAGATLGMSLVLPVVAGAV